MLYLGGTKCGALFGEALVIFKKQLNEDFRFSIKQKGAMLAKGWLLGIQFEALFEGDLYQKIGEHANAMAEKIKQAIEQKGYSYQWIVTSWATKEENVQKLIQSIQQA